MSEIFNFLKKTEAECRKLPNESPQAGAPIAESIPAVAVPVEVIGAKAPLTEQPPGSSEFEAAISIEPAAAEPIPAAPGPRVQVGGGRFDLSAADRQIRNILDPLTMVGEQFRMLRSKLELMQRHRGIKTLLVTSSIPREGKTFTACGLAGVIAQEPGKRVILIDADMRKPKSGSDLGINGLSMAAGLSQVLRGEAGFHEMLLNSTNLEFYFLPSGPLPPNPSELLSSPALERTIKSAAESFDWVIIDSPPALSLADATLIVPVCDAVLLVVHANATPTKLISDAIQRIGREKICGVVMNRLKHIQSSRYYYRYYHGSSEKRKH